MTVLGVAKKDFKATRRTKMLWGSTLFLGVIAGLFMYAFNPSNVDNELIIESLFRTLSVLISVLVPIVTLMTAYLAIAGERESGDIKFTLSLPNSRRDMYFGKVVSRLTVMTLAIVGMFAVATLVTLYRFGTVQFAVAAGLLVVSIVYALVYVSITVAMSAALKSRTQAIGASIGVYFATVILYALPQVRIGLLVSYLHQDVLGMQPNLDLYNFVQYTSPFLAYQKVKNLIMPEQLEITPFVPQSASEGTQAFDLPFYLTDEFAIVILAAWFFVPLAIGYVQFQRTDLT